MMMRTLTRIMFIEAIANRTLPCDVRDSEIATYDPDNFPEKDLPFCGVYTDTDKELTLVLGVTLAAAKPMPATEDEEFSSPMIESGLPGQTASFPPTDIGLEMTIDALEYQIKQALKDPDNQWADALKRGARIELDEVESVRGTLRKRNGSERLAGREVKIPIRMVPDLDVGSPIPETGFWPDLFALLANNELYAPFTENYHRMIASRTFDDLQQTIAQMNLNTAATRALGLKAVPANT